MWLKGFDEFMNLVIDDAVEVKQITKTNTEESRRNLGPSLQCYTRTDRDSESNAVQAKYY